MKRILLALALLTCCLPLQSAQKNKKHRKLYVPKAFKKEAPKEKATAAQTLLELYETAQRRSSKLLLMRSLNNLLASDQKITVTTAANVRPFIL